MTLLFSKRRLVVMIMLFVLTIGMLYGLYQDAVSRYDATHSVHIFDRHGQVLAVAPNNKDHYTLPGEPLPAELTELLLEKEDRYFYYHPGINPISSLRGLYNLTTENGGGGSTITQQLAKNLLGNETQRNARNKLTELLYALALELFLSKEDILTWYSDTVYLGNQLQGFPAAAHAYYDKPLDQLTTNEQLVLLATISHPTSRNPWQNDSDTYAAALSQQLLPDHTFTYPTVDRGYSLQTTSNFELRTADLACAADCITTIDHELTEDIRAILQRHVESAWLQNARNGAVVVIDPQTAELLALVGSVDPASSQDGNQINMALQPRPVGSTIKPFIYTLGFEQGLRPYTLVDDREYKYSISTGFSLYPKNYDGQYRGVITIHEALSNSLNVPTVKTLEYIGLTPFYDFMSERLQFEPIQPYDSYQYGIALGGLEMDLLTLTHYFTVFARAGELAPLQVFTDQQPTDLPRQSTVTEAVHIFSPEHVSLTHEILSDRLRGVNQFGMAGNLEVSAADYGVKTGTSRDWHDSWVVGYTPDFVVGVWLGNSENERMDQLSGQSGAGAIWHDVMEYLVASDYYHASEFTYPPLEPYVIDDSTEWGLPADNVQTARMHLMQDALITSPLPGDVFGWYDGLAIPLTATAPATWTSNGEAIGTGDSISFLPDAAGAYELSAVTTDDRREIISITITAEE